MKFVLEVRNQFRFSRSEPNGTKSVPLRDCQNNPINLRIKAGGATKPSQGSAAADKVNYVVGTNVTVGRYFADSNFVDTGVRDGR